jgi:2-amino-4-hydroxy-6-hydroxymethyldihydropteridine diphosphokinase
MNLPELILPHPRLGSRLFVLSPLAELEPGLKDSFTGKTVAEMEDSLHLAIAAGEVEMQEIVRSCWQDELPAEANTPRPNITPSPAGS